MLRASCVSTPRRGVVLGALVNMGRGPWACGLDILGSVFGPFQDATGLKEGDGRAIVGEKTAVVAAVDGRHRADDGLNAGRRRLR